MKRFILNIASISVVLTLIGWLVFTQFFPQYYLPVLPLLLLFFALTSVSIHAYQLKLARKDMTKFTLRNMLVTVFKLFLYTAVAVVYIAVDKKNAKVFVICFMVFYFVFTVFEVVSLIRVTTNKQKKA